MSNLVACNTYACILNLMKTATTKTAADKANEALDAMMTEADRAYWAAVGENEKRVEGKGRGR